MENKVALVTGGGSGIGRAAALKFATGGTRVLVADLNEDGGNETVQMITDAGGQAAFTRVDVSQEADVEAMVKQAVETFGGLDYAFNNAGTSGGATQLHEMTAEEWNQVINVNLSGVFYCLKHEISYMMQNGGGAIVNTSSIAGLSGAYGSAHYTASKHGVTGLTRMAAVTYGEAGIRVNSVHPGAILTAMTQPYLDAGMEAMFKQMSTMGRIGQAEEVAAAVVWLCSDEAAFINGAQLTIDGGNQAR